MVLFGCLVVLCDVFLFSLLLFCIVAFLKQLLSKSQRCFLMSPLVHSHLFWRSLEFVDFVSYHCSISCFVDFLYMPLLSSFFPAVYLHWIISDVSARVMTVQLIFNTCSAYIYHIFNPCYISFRKFNTFKVESSITFFTLYSTKIGFLVTNWTDIAVHSIFMRVF